MAHSRSGARKVQNGTGIFSRPENKEKLKEWWVHVKGSEVNLKRASLWNREFQINGTNGLYTIK